MKSKKFLQSVNRFAQKMASQIYFRSLRDGFVSTVPFLVIGGLLILVNNVIIAPDGGWISGLVDHASLATMQEFGNKIVNGSYNIYALIMGAFISNNLAKNRGQENPIFESILTIAVIFVLLPLNNMVTPVGAGKAVEVSGIVQFANLGTSGVFVAIFSAILTTEFYIKLSRSPKLKIKLGSGVPLAVAQSFEAMASIMITLLAFGALSFGIHLLTHMEIGELVNQIIQTPLIHLTGSLPGFLLLMFVNNFLFALGIHPGGIVNPILEPPLLVAMNQNTAAYAAHETIQNIIVLPFRDVYGFIGGTGSTIALIIAIFAVGKIQANKQFAKVSGPLGIFNINEPVIFGFPVVLNPIIMIPFIIGPMLSFVIAYFATWAGFVGKLVVYVPWSMPPLFNAFIASGGDFRNVILQVILIAMMVLLYIPFLRIHESTMKVEAEAENEVKNEVKAETAETSDFADFADFQ
ncbi:PTS sugar transporter subunit IIC [Lactovum odontotermitis]